MSKHRPKHRPDHRPDHRPESRRALYTVSPTLNFADALVSGVLSRLDGDMTRLVDVVIYLPNRRAQTSLRDAFLRVSKGKPIVLPTMRPIGEVDEDEVTFLGAGLGINPSNIPPAISDVRRLALLEALLAEFAKHSTLTGLAAPAQRWRLARELARLMDQIDSEGLDVAALADIVPDDYARHWGVTLEFLNFILTSWPALLHEEGAINPGVRRNRLMALLSDLLARTPPGKMVIAAGTTGTLPATRGLLKVIAGMPDGAIVLPGFDNALSDAEWGALDVTHPQYTMKNLLLELKVDRHEVQDWHGEEEPGASARGRMLRTALVPASLTAMWQGYDPSPADFSGLRLLTAPSRREEAEAIALMLREALETPGKTAALVTPDRVLARYVRMALERFEITIDDTGGDRALISPQGRLLSLIAEAAASRFSPVSLLALLKHPDVTMGQDRGVWLRFVRTFDRHVLRGPRPAPGLKGLTARVARCQRRNPEKVCEGTVARWQALASLLEPFEALLGTDAGFDTLLTAHLAVAEALAAGRDVEEENPLWMGEAGEALAGRLHDLLENGAVVRVDGAESYSALFGEMLTDVTVRPVWGRHPRLYIWGPIEARMQRADRMILGSLNEGTWPTETRPDPWLNRDMRKSFGLPPGERRIGQSAHDFLQAASAPEVFFTRSEKIDGSPAVASRWLFRIEALCGCEIPTAQHYLDWARGFDRAQKISPVQAPAPTPPVAARPKQLSVTQVEKWLRDPYALYAEKILGLRALDDLEEAASGKHKGTMMHDALERFLKEEGPTRGQAGLSRLLALGEAAFETVLDQPGVYAFWWPRFERLARWFIETEAARSSHYDTEIIEERGEITVGSTGFKLFAIADRIDRNRETGALDIIDYKTGTIPAKKAIEGGYAPQLPLEAYIALGGGFRGLAADKVENLSFWKISGGDPAGEIKHPFGDLEETVAQATERLVKLVTAFSRQDIPYLSHPKPAEILYHDYDHLARVKEWRSRRKGGSDDQ